MTSLSRLNPSHPASAPRYATLPARQLPRIPRSGCTPAWLHIASPPDDSEPLPAIQQEYVPYCDSHGTTVGSNKCNALCAGYDESEIEPCAAKVKDSVAAAVCPCTKELRRVCDMYGTELGPNPCNAECKGYDASEFSMEYCTTPAVEPCTTPCTLELEPVCDDKGTELGPNACAAVCKGYDSASFSTEYCTPRHQMTQLVTSITNQEPCMCTKVRASGPGTDRVLAGKSWNLSVSACPQEYSPVCDAKGTVVGPNLCSAQCAGYDGADLSTCSFVELPEAAQNGTQGIRDDLDRVARGGENLQTICVTPRQTGGPHLCTTFDTLIGFGNVTDDEVAGKPDPAGKSDPAGQADPAGKADAAGESAAAGLGPLGLLLATCALAVQLIA